MKTFLNTKELAKRWGYGSVVSLRNRRSSRASELPPSIKLPNGRVLYDLADVEEFERKYKEKR